MMVDVKNVPGGLLPVIAIDRRAAKPLHRQIYDAYRATIVSRALQAGQQIPSTRVLASELGISRIPVLNAYAQLLAEGYFESRVGAGTFVSSSLPDQLMSVDVNGRSSRNRPSGPRPVSRRSQLYPPYKGSSMLRGWGAFGVHQPA